MRSRICSIMDTGKKKTGLAILCVAWMLTVGTGAAFAANAATQNPPENTKGSTEVTPWIAGAFLPNPDVYAKYADFGITISEDGAKLLYNGQPVRLFADEGSDAEAFYLDEAGNVNLSVVRNTTGEITGMESITAQKAQEYQATFFAEELGGSYPKEQDIAKVQEGVQVGANKYEAYQPFGVTYSAADGILRFNGQRVRFFIDQAEEGVNALWTDEAGTVNLAVLRDASGQITDIESISAEKAQEYQAAANPHIDLDGLEEELEAKMSARYPNGIEQ